MMFNDAPRSVKILLALAVVLVIILLFNEQSLKNETITEYEEVLWGSAIGLFGGAGVLYQNRKYKDEKATLANKLVSMDNEVISLTTENSNLKEQNDMKLRELKLATDEKNRLTKLNSVLEINLSRISSPLKSDSATAKQKATEHLDRVKQAEEEINEVKTA